MRDFLLGSADTDVFGAFRPGPSGVFEATGQRRTETEMDNLILEAAETQLRGDAMSAALTWVDDGDWSYEALDALLEDMASDSDEDDESDDDEDMTDDEQEHYEALTDTVLDALVSLGGDADNIELALSGDEDAAQRLGKHLSSRLDNVTKDDDDLVSEFSVGGELVMEAMKKVVRNGKTKWVRKKKRRKKRRTAAQRAALKKARRKSGRSSAKRSRKRSMRRRRQMGA